MGLIGILIALGLLDLARLPRLEHPPACAGRRDPCGRIGRRAAARALDANLHGERGAIRHAVLPDFSPRRPVRQADGGLGLGDVDRQIHDRAPRAAALGARGRARRRDRHLWRRQPVRRLLRPRADGASIVPRGGDSEAPHAGGDRARHDDLHHVGSARNARDSERDPDAVLRHHALRRAGARIHRGDRDVRLRHVVARARGAKRARQGRGLWGGRSA